MKAAIVRFFGHGGGVAWYLIGGVLLMTAASTALFVSTLGVRLRRDITRMVFEDNLELFQNVKGYVGLSDDALERELNATPEEPPDRPYLVVSLEENRLWYKKMGEVLFETQVATGSGKTLVKEGGNSVWKFDTPRGRLAVQSKEEDPAWAPPDWHYVEQASKRGLGIARFERGQALPTSDGSVITVDGDDVVKRYPDGREAVLTATDGREIVADGKIIVPPLGTNQRKYKGVLGTHRLNLGHGYGIHGTNRPETIGRSVSHGCIRVRNADIERLYETVPVGTPVYIY